MSCKSKHVKWDLSRTQTGDCRFVLQGKKSKKCLIFPHLIFLQVKSLQTAMWRAASMIGSSVWVVASAHPRIEWLGRWFLSAAELSPYLVCTIMLLTTSKHCLTSSSNSLETSSSWLGLQSQLASLAEPAVTLGWPPGLTTGPVCCPSRVPFQRDAAQTADTTTNQHCSLFVHLACAPCSWCSLVAGCMWLPTVWNGWETASTTLLLPEPLVRLAWSLHKHGPRVIGAQKSPQPSFRDLRNLTLLSLTWLPLLLAVPASRGLAFSFNILRVKSNNNKSCTPDNS